MTGIESKNITIYVNELKKPPTAVGVSPWGYREVLNLQHRLELAGDCRVSQPEAMERILQEWKACKCAAKKAV